jgi:deoxyadenosine/deoxycytidine kinase
MAVETVFVLAGLSGSGKTSLGRLTDPAPEWPLMEWWEESRMLCTLDDADNGLLPNKLAVEIDFSWQFTQHNSPLAPMQHLNARVQNVVTVWAAPETLQRRLIERRSRLVRHPNDELLTKTYASPSEVAEFYARWLPCVDAFKPDHHCAFDSDAARFRDLAWLGEVIRNCQQGQ